MSCENSECVSKLSRSTAPTKFGPITKDSATPSEPQSDATAVAVVLSLRGNHAEDSNGGAACVTGPARPLRNCPAVIVLNKTSGILKAKSTLQWSTPRSNRNEIGKELITAKIWWGGLVEGYISYSCSSGYLIFQVNERPNLFETLLKYLALTSYDLRV